MLLDAQICQVCTRVVKYMLFILHSRVYKGLTRENGFQPRSVLASLFIKGNKCMQEKKDFLLFWLRKADTVWKPVEGFRGVLVLQRETTCGWVQWKALDALFFSGKV